MNRDESTRDDVSPSAHRDAAPRHRGERRWMRHRELWVAVVLLVLAFVVYAPGLDGAFVFDDRRFILDNDGLWSSPLELDLGRAAAPDTASGGEPNDHRASPDAGYDFAFFAPAVTDVAPDAHVNTNFRPLRFLSYQVDAWLTESFFEREPGAEPSPFFFHLQNILWHGLNAVLVFLIALRLLEHVARHRSPGSASARDASFAFWGAVSIAVLFTVHPLHVESVTYISGRRDVLFTFFYLLAVAIFIVKRDTLRDAAAPVRLGWATVIALAFGLALLAKEMAATLPAALVLVDAFLARTARERLRPAWGVLAALLLVGGVVVADILLHKNPGLGAPYWGGSFWTAFWTSLRTWGRAVALVLWPHPLTVDYSYDAIEPSTGPFDPWTGALSVLLWGALVFVAWRRWKLGAPSLLIAVAVFGVTWSPVSQLVFPHPERFAERFVYLPSLAILWAVAALIGPMLRSRREVLVAGVAGLTILGTVTAWNRIADWSTRETLWARAVEVFPDCARAHYQLGVLALEAAQRADREGNEFAAQREWRRAGKNLEAAAEIFDRLDRPSPWESGLARRAEAVLVSLGKAGVYEVHGSLADRFVETVTDPDEEADLAGTPGFLLQHMELLAQEGRWTEGSKAAEQLVAHPESNANMKVRGHLFLAGVAQQGHDLDSAFQSIDAAARAAESSRQKGLVAYQRGLAEEQRQRYEAAEVAYAEAARHYGDSAESWCTARYKVAECQQHTSEASVVRETLVGILERDPEHWPSVFSLADLDLKLNRLEAAEEGFERVWRATGDVRARDGLRKVAARRAIAESGAEAPSPSGKRIEVFLELAKRRIAEGELEKAGIAIREAEKLAEGPVERERRLALRALAGELAAMQQSWGEAARQYEQYVELTEPGERDPILLQYADVLRREGRPKEAYRFLAGEWQADSRHPKLAKNLGGLAVLLGDADAARTWYRAYLAQEDISEAERTAVETALRSLLKDGGDSSPR